MEAHLNNEELKNYLNKTGVELNFGTLYNEQFMFSLFYSTLESLIRFERNGKRIEWWDILEGVITTTHAKRKRTTEKPLQQAS